MSCFSWCFDLVSSLLKKQPTLELPKHSVRIIKLLADGATGLVYLVQDDRSNKQYALKKIIAQSPEQAASALNEMKIHSQFSHPNLVQLLDFMKIDSPDGNATFYFLFPFFSMGSLDTLLTAQNSPLGILSEYDIIVIFSEICKGILAMHSANPSLAHRDIKPGNVLIGWPQNSNHSSGGKLNVSSLLVANTDFGSCQNSRVAVRNRREAVQLQEWASVNCTMSYRAPELFDPPSNFQLDERSDVWSLGCVLFALMYRKGCFDCDDIGGSVALSVLSGKYNTPSNPRYSRSLNSLLATLLQVKPADRPFLPAVLERLEILKNENKRN